jgi:HD-GYP domain-containing protein (c-di-GMP phosphodiesterase class II)
MPGTILCDAIYGKDRKTEKFFPKKSVVGWLALEKLWELHRNGELRNDMALCYSSPEEAMQGKDYSRGGFSMEKLHDTMKHFRKIFEIMQVSSETHGLSDQEVSRILPRLSALAANIGLALESLRDYADPLLDTVKSPIGVDEYTFGHSIGTMTTALVLAEKARREGKLNLTFDDFTNLAFGTLFHDLGKARIPQEILDKPEKLSDEEWKIMRQHPTFSAEMVRQIADACMTNGDPSLSHIDFDVVAAVAGGHHFRPDGKGYGDAKAEEAANKDPFIRKMQRIAGISDTFDAIVSERCYKKAIPNEKFLDILRDVAGTQLDQDLAETFQECIVPYPRGYTVLLENGIAATVVEATKDKIVVVAKDSILASGLLDVGKELTISKQQVVYGAMLSRDVEKVAQEIQETKDLDSLSTPALNLRLRMDREGGFYPLLVPVVNPLRNGVMRKTHEEMQRNVEQVISSVLTQEKSPKKTGRSTPTRPDFFGERSKER